MLLIAYRGSLRGDEVVNLLPSDVWIEKCDPIDEACIHFPLDMIGRPLLWIRVSSSKTLRRVRAMECLFFHFYLTVSSRVVMT